MLKNLSTLALGFILALVPLSTKAGVLDDIQENSVLKVGIRTDAVPFGYLDSRGELAGYCLHFINILQQRIKEELNKDALLIRLYRTSTFNRFNLIDDGIAHLECGPNTIREEIPYQIEFSAPFFVTGTQFFIDKENRALVNTNGSLATVRIGVLQRTSTQAILEKEYPLADIQPFQGVFGRIRGIQAVQQGRLDAFVSDGILLLGEVAQLGLPLSDYLLVPELPLTCDRYGMILPNNDPPWKKLVDSVIASPRSQQLLAEILEDISLVETAALPCLEKNEQ